MGIFISFHFNIQAPTRWTHLDQHGPLLGSCFKAVRSDNRLVAKLANEPSAQSSRGLYSGQPSASPYTTLQLKPFCFMLSLEIWNISLIMSTFSNCWEIFFSAHISIGVQWFGMNRDVIHSRVGPKRPPSSCLVSQEVSDCLWDDQKQCTSGVNIPGFSSTWLNKAGVNEKKRNVTW